MLSWLLYDLIDFLPLHVQINHKDVSSKTHNIFPSLQALASIQATSVSALNNFSATCTLTYATFV